MTKADLSREAVLRVGEVVAVDGRRVYVLVDHKKNATHMFLDGDILTNISVNGFVEIRKGFTSIIGKVDGEKIEEDLVRPAAGDREPTIQLRRTLTVSLTGHIDERGQFTAGTKELPLVGNEAFLLTTSQLQRVHDLVRGSDLWVSVGRLYSDDLQLRLPVDGLFNSHIAIFGNTGSGKSNTLARLYQELTQALAQRHVQHFRANTRFLLFDFNGEYAAPSCITEDKTVYNLTTQNTDGPRLPLDEDVLLDIEVLSILADATEKTQKPFLRRVTRFLRRVRAVDGDSEAYVRGIIRRQITDTLQMTDKVRAFLLRDYLEQVVPDENEHGEYMDLTADLEWHNKVGEFLHTPSGAFLGSEPERIEETILHEQAAHQTFGTDLLDDLILMMYLQLIDDVLRNRAQNEHIAPVINRLRAKRVDIERLLDFSGEGQFWSSNFVVVNLDHVNLVMKKTLPLLLSKKLYAEHKRAGAGKTLTIIIDEAHNILSRESSREAESWKDYRLETFEELIKEGRKFGVFLTIASQRPNDISPTISSQAHNYFIHRLINERDLKTIASVVSYIDRLSEESIPTLPTGTCILSGVVSPMPIKLIVTPLSDVDRPQSTTRSFGVIVPPAAMG